MKQNIDEEDVTEGLGNFEKTESEGGGRTSRVARPNPQ